VSASSEGSADKLKIVAKILQIVHGGPLKSAWNLAPESRRVNETGGSIDPVTCESRVN
jgi:hypothetical protein